MQNKKQKYYGYYDGPRLNCNLPSEELDAKIKKEKEKSDSLTSWGDTAEELAVSEA